ncbi:MAG: ankyrin repeat domain-containing protein [Blastocatellia bacterium]|nr:ankyrin repeat domain-containing protein [Blastocatellia bacterium]
MTSKPLLTALFVALFPLTAFAQNPNEDFLAAARKGDVETIKSLLTKGVDVNTKTNYGATALSYACDRGNIEIVKILLEHGADPNSQDTFYGATPIIWAAQKGHAEVVAALLDKGARGTDQALMMGIAGDHTEMVRVILKKGKVLPQTLALAMKRATDGGKTEMVKLLEEAGAESPAKSAAPVDRETLHSYIGRYRAEDGKILSLKFSDGKLMGSFPDRGIATLKPVDKTTFSLVEAEGVKVTFQVDGEKVTGLLLEQQGTKTVFKRVEL